MRRLLLITASWITLLGASGAPANAADGRLVGCAAHPPELKSAIRVDIFEGWSLEARQHMVEGLVSECSMFADRGKCEFYLDCGGFLKVQRTRCAGRGTGTDKKPFWLGSGAFSIEPALHRLSDRCKKSPNPQECLESAGCENYSL